METKTKKEQQIDYLIDSEVLARQNHLVGELLANIGGKPSIEYEDIINMYVDTEEEAKDLGYDSLEAMQDNGEDMKEVFEWLLVTAYLAKHIEELGGVIIDCAYGTWWGREETGQSLTMDAMLNSVADKLMEVK